MPILLAMAVAAGIAPAQPQNPRSWITPDDFPRAALDGRESGYTAFKLLLSAKGRVQRCDVIGSSGFADLDALTCRLLSDRAQFRPATDQAGQPVPGTWSSTGGWMAGTNGNAIAAWRRAHPTPSLELEDVTVERLPPHSKDPVTVTVGLLVAPDDQVQGCGPAPDAPPALAATACRHALALAKPQHLTDAEGRAIASVQAVTTRFGTAAAFVGR